MELAPQAVKLRKLGMTFREIAEALETDDMLVRKAIAYGKRVSGDAYLKDLYKFEV